MRGLCCRWQTQMTMEIMNQHLLSPSRHGRSFRIDRSSPKSSYHHITHHNHHLHTDLNRRIRHRILSKAAVAIADLLYYFSYFCYIITMDDCVNFVYPKQSFK
ncbi:unnamed protein product [Linum tenue]|uniref:Uncharacterized protein n=1 Tax=Linum tenue TaxID=586396 RepID=A0AAV0LWL6_9ROSI|nr:unnamed protein product [Linum tenue]